MQKRIARKMLFIYPVIESNDPYGYQTGLGSLMATMRSAGLEVGYLPLYGAEDLVGLEDVLRSEMPDIVGIYTVYSQLRFLEMITDAIKRNSDAVIICGGPHATLRPEDIFACSKTDLVCRGEAEIGMAKYIAAGCAENVDGLISRYIGSEKLTVAETPRDLDALEFPYRPKAVYDEVLKRFDGVARFVFSRGCPYPCTYCSNHALRKLLGEPYVRIRSPRLAIQEIERVIAEFDVSRIHLDDDRLALNKKWLHEFLTLYRQKIQLPFSCNFRPNEATKEIFEALRDAGCIYVAMGVETGDEELAKKIMKRNVSNRQIKKAFLWAKEAGIETFALNMVGLPHETTESFEKTLKLNQEIKPDGAVMYVFTPYPGTELRDYCESVGWIENSAINAGGERAHSELRMPQFPPESIQNCLNRFNAEWRASAFDPAALKRKTGEQTQSLKRVAEICRKNGYQAAHIYGASITGQTLAREARKEGMLVLGFVDGDQSLIGREVDGVSVHSLTPDLAAKANAFMVGSFARGEEIALSIERAYATYEKEATIFFIRGSHVIMRSNGNVVEVAPILSGLADAI